MATIRESDWKVLRSLKPIALERFCLRALEEIQSATSEPSSTAHERYLLVYRIVEQEDQELGRLFDDVRRSNAVSPLVSMRTAGLISDEEYAGFSPELRAAIQEIQSRRAE